MSTKSGSFTSPPPAPKNEVDDDANLEISSVDLSLQEAELVRARYRSVIDLMKAQLAKPRLLDSLEESTESELVEPRLLFWRLTSDSMSQGGWSDSVGEGPLMDVQIPSVKATEWEPRYSPAANKMLKIFLPNYYGGEESPTKVGIPSVMAADLGGGKEQSSHSPLTAANSPAANNMLRILLPKYFDLVRSFPLS